MEEEVLGLWCIPHIDGFHQNNLDVRRHEAQKGCSGEPPHVQDLFRDRTSNGLLFNCLDLSRQVHVGILISSNVLYFGQRTGGCNERTQPTGCCAAFSPLMHLLIGKIAIRSAEKHFGLSIRRRHRRSFGRDSAHGKAAHES